ncbi:MAG: prepilin-type N-terminal cleavage/methylation domain-containing protein [Magnetococcus sp. YQC-5]
MNAIRNALKKRQEGGFSLVEMAIVLVIIGLIVSAIAVGKTTMKKGEANKLVQTYMKPWIEAAINEYNNANAPGTTKGDIINQGSLPPLYDIGGRQFTQPQRTFPAGSSRIKIEFPLSGEMDPETWAEVERAVRQGIQPLCTGEPTMTDAVVDTTTGQITTQASVTYADTGLTLTNGTDGIEVNIAVASKGN